MAESFNREIICMKLYLKVELLFFSSVNYKKLFRSIKTYKKQST
jgi:hypothetical protein